MSRRVALFVASSVIGAISAGGGAASAACGLEEGGRTAPLSHQEDDPRVAQFVDAGLEFLVKQQNDDRSFSVVKGEDVIQAPLAVTALSALAFMANGSTLGRGKYQRQVRSAIEYLLDHQTDYAIAGPPAGPLVGDQELKPGYFKVESDTTSRTHGHGYATLAIAEAYGTLSLDPKLGEAATSKMRQDQQRMKIALQRAVLLIERSQSDKGGWYYEPGDNQDEGSVTITMIQAMRAARDVGIDVDKRVIDDAVKYVHDSQRASDGGFRYQIAMENVTFALTAAAVSTLNATGDYDSSVIDRGIEFMKRNDPVFDPESHLLDDQKFPWYARLYAAQAYYLHRDRKLWERWFPALIENLEGRRDEATGAFEDSQYGRIYATASACLMLQIDYQYLPIFQR